MLSPAELSGIENDEVTKGTRGCLKGYNDVAYQIPPQRINIAVPSGCIRYTVTSNMSWVLDEKGIDVDVPAELAMAGYECEILRVDPSATQE